MFDIIYKGVSRYKMAFMFQCNIFIVDLDQ
jgi:hypothetical protein